MGSIGKICYECGKKTNRFGVCSCGAGVLTAMARRVAARMLNSTRDEATKAAAIVANAHFAVKSQATPINLDRLMGIDNSQADTDGNTTNTDDSGQGVMCPECGEARLDSTGTCPECGYIQTPPDRAAAKKRATWLH